MSILLKKVTTMLKNQFDICGYLTEVLMDVFTNVCPSMSFSDGRDMTKLQTYNVGVF